jgi:hypothetical protein
LVQRLESGSSGQAQYLAEVGPSCKFEIEIGKATSGGDGQFDFSFAPAAIVRRAGADCTQFLASLAPALGFSGDVPQPEPTSRLEASVTILGKNQSRANANAQIAGAFVGNPPGPWLVTKLFLADGEGEVFLNLNETDGFGEFSIKDPDYAELVVTELAKVLLRERRVA